jgi:hypothetical protein
VLIHDNRFARCFRLAIPDYLIYYRSHDVDAQVKEVQITPLQSHQFTSAHAGQSVTHYHRPFPQIQLIEQPMQFRHIKQQRQFLVYAI